MNRLLLTAVKTGEVIFGYNQTLQTLRAGKAKLIVTSSNCPKHFEDKLNQYAKLVEIPIFKYNGANTDLGRVVAKPFAIAVMAVNDPGESNILSLVK